MANNELEMRMAERLLRKCFSHMGMVREIEMKCVLMRVKAQAIRDRGGSVKTEMPELAATLTQMRRDLAKYSRKMKNIREELDKYGIFRDMA